MSTSEPLRTPPSTYSSIWDESFGSSAWIERRLSKPVRALMISSVQLKASGARTGPVDVHRDLTIYTPSSRALLRSGRPDYQLVHPLEMETTYLNARYPLQVDRYVPSELLQPYQVIPVQPRVMDIVRKLVEWLHFPAGLGRSGCPFHLLDALPEVAGVGVDGEEERPASQLRSQRLAKGTREGRG